MKFTFRLFEAMISQTFSVSEEKKNFITAFEIIKRIF